ncbi:NlpC/P60 family protein [Methylocaldum szegediense]|uniref:NlpC/P60 family protein n=1 Tax=Methylocaldum szegediense TaxID=73780 RepID=UPI00047B460B|nr:NlpC/P60 family protein [Methylocaldum szegediense]
MTHWAGSYIGKRWESGAMGPDAYDCFTLVRHLQKERFGRELPLVNVDANDILAVGRAFRDSPERANWVYMGDVDFRHPKEGDLVEMAHARFPSHIGMWIEANRGGVLHCVYGMGVVFSDRQSLRNSGWGRIEFYRHRDEL